MGERDRSGLRLRGVIRKDPWNEVPPVDMTQRRGSLKRKKTGQGKQEVKRSRLLRGQARGTLAPGALGTGGPRRGPPARFWLLRQDAGPQPTAVHLCVHSMNNYTARPWRPRTCPRCCFRRWDSKGQNGRVSCPHGAHHLVGEKQTLNR